MFMSRKIIITLSLITFLFSAYLLLTGSELLMYPLIKSPVLPLGNVITWLGFIAFPLSVWFGIGSLYNPQTKADRIFRRLAIVLVVLGLLWAPVSFLLAGNLTNEFSGSAVGFQGSPQASEIFWGFSYVVAAAPVVLILLVLINKFIRLFRK